jgi:hypothetical protein
MRRATPRPRSAHRFFAAAALLFLVLPAVAVAKDDQPDRAKRFRIAPPNGWQRVDLSCEEWRYDSPEGRGTIYLAVRRGLGGMEPARAAARSLAETLFRARPDQIPNPDTTYHGAPVTRLIGTFHSGSAGFTNSTAIPLADGSYLLWLEVGLLPPNIGRSAEIGIAERHHVAWRSLRSTGKAKRTDCRTEARAVVPLPTALERWVGEPRQTAEASSPTPAARSAPSSSVVSLEQLIAAGIVTDGRTPGPPNVGGSGLASHPFLTVHEVRVSPSLVSPGAEMQLQVDLTVSQAGAADAQLPVMMSHTILYGDRVVYEGSPESYDVPNNRRATIRKTLRAASRRGAFSVRVKLSYRSAADSGEAAFQIR